ncbi:MAG: glycosyltransferase family 9 protein [Bdellovibrionales bacterium]|nr:glycosyltransferase family 9 protein [Bdellovibrionales bacterium]
MYPQDELAIFCRKGLGALFKELQLVDSFVEIDKNLGGWKKAEDQLKKQNYNLIVSVHQSFRTAKIVSSLNAKNKIGYYKWWNFWSYNKRVLRPMHLPEALRQLYLISSLDSELYKSLESLQVEKNFLNEQTQLNLHSSLSIPQWASCSIRSELSLHKLNLTDFMLPERYIVVSPGSIWPTKRWTESGFIELVESLPLPCVLLGSSDEKEICERIHKSTSNSINLCGKTNLLESLLILSKASLAVSNDSGAQHMAAAVDCPVVSVFGPTVLEFGYRPWTSKARVAEVDLKCRPCGKHGAKECPLGTHDCMKKLRSEQVLKLAKELL